MPATTGQMQSVTAAAPWWRRAVATPASGVVSGAVAVLALVVLVQLFRWAIADAVWTGSAAECRLASGACWAFVGEKLEFVLFGLYPPAERWRAGSAMVLLAAAVAVTAHPRAWRRWLPVFWIVAGAAALWLMAGGGGLAPVPTRLWGGLPVTLMLTAVGLVAGFPLAVALALARRSSLVVPRVVATLVVEGVRGVPLIAVLYVAALVVPLALPRGVTIDKLLLALGAVTLFAAAYLAEAVRSGLQMVPRGQRAAALALGLSPWQANRTVVLPQALRIVVPSFVSIAVGFFQDTSLVVIIGLFDLLNTARVAAQDPEWLGFHTEAYVFVALLYFTGSMAASQYGVWLERRMGGVKGGVAAGGGGARTAQGGTQ